MIEYKNFGLPHYDDNGTSYAIHIYTIDDNSTVLWSKVWHCCCEFCAVPIPNLLIFRTNAYSIIGIDVWEKKQEKTKKYFSLIFQLIFIWAFFDEDPTAVKITNIVCNCKKMINEIYAHFCVLTKFISCVLNFDWFVTIWIRVFVLTWNSN